MKINEFPIKDEIRQALGPVYEDDRGKIEMIIDNLGISSVSRITSVKGSSRAVHCHCSDYHVCLLTKGLMHYFERPIFSQKKVVPLLMSPGELFYTKAGTEHEMLFLEDSEFWCFSKNPRSQNEYENDTFKLPKRLSEQ